MLHTIIAAKRNAWVQSGDCTVRHLLDYIRGKGELRDTQIDAIETYLFLKIAGKNKPLWQLFAEGFFASTTEFERGSLDQTTRHYLEADASARALYDFARQPDSPLPELEKVILAQPDSIDYETFIKAMFYGVTYADYLFSLPMGAGKTYLMAALMYIDLYFALNEPANKNFAHNFLVLIPSGLKSSIVPSLKTIERVDPSWVLAEPSASRIRGLMRFEVLDQTKSAKNSNKARNPNAQKVNHYVSQYGLMGLVLVVNAEKVILDRLELSSTHELIERSDDERDMLANELRHTIGKLPNLQILIDEVHHAATDDIKLRQVVNGWNERGSVTTVLGFSGTPYLSSPDVIPVGNVRKMRLSQINNTVYYYPLVSGIQNFLKKPTVKIARIPDPLHIIEKGIEDFYRHYGHTTYPNGTIAKLAVYCGTIPRLENEVYPLVVRLANKFGDTEENILKYHKGNAKFTLPRQNELEFNSLDTPLSKKRIVLLVQIGKEGWDCRSLTGVILAQQGDCPQNMVLQTSCRCLRQVEKGADESALVWLNEANAETLNKQLRVEQQTSIQELNRIAKLPPAKTPSRKIHSKAPAVDLSYAQINFRTNGEEAAIAESKLLALFENLNAYRRSMSVATRNGFGGAEESAEIHSMGEEPARFSDWLQDIAKESFSGITLHHLAQHSAILRKVFDVITFQKDSQMFYNENYSLSAIKSQIRLSFMQMDTFTRYSHEVESI